MCVCGGGEGRSRFFGGVDNFPAFIYFRLDWDLDGSWINSMAVIQKHW